MLESPYDFLNLEDSKQNVTIMTQESHREDTYDQASLIFQIDQYRLRVKILAKIESEETKDDGDDEGGEKLVALLP